MWCVVPAAGRGARFGASRPKQYIEVLGRPVLEWTLERLASHPAINGVMLVLAADDRHWSPRATFAGKPLCTATGGAERADSVLAGLAALPASVGPNDWVLVHDAARPCLRHADLDRLIAAGRASRHGALLASPLRDTVKRGGVGGISEATVDRHGLWRAYTPQMARRSELGNALAQAMKNGSKTVTDEASALEAARFFPLLIEGCDDNLKLTSETDLALVEAVLRHQLDRS